MCAHRKRKTTIVDGKKNSLPMDETTMPVEVNFVAGGTKKITCTEKEKERKITILDGKKKGSWLRERQC